MSDQIDVAFVQQFKDNLFHLAQQRGSRLAGTVVTEMVVGKYAHFERLGATVAQKRTSRHADTPLVDTPHSRRRVILEDYEVADLIDKQDEIRLLIDPKSAYAQAMGMALGRQLDDIIIAAIEGNARAIDSSDSSSNVAVPASNIVDEDFVAANSDVTIEKLIEAKRIMMSDEVDPEDDKFFVLDSNSLGALLNETEIQSADFNTVKALVQGQIDTFMGFKFIHSERLLSNSEGFKNCLAYVRPAVRLGMGEDIKVRIAERPDKAFATQVYASLTAGAVRVEEAGVVIVQAFRS